MKKGKRGDFLNFLFHLQGSASWVPTLEAKWKRHVLLMVKILVCFYNSTIYRFTRYQPLPYGTHWTWPDVQWKTPGPAFEQNTMLLLSDSMDRFLSFFMHTFPFIRHLALSLFILLLILLLLILHLASIRSS